MTVTKYVTLFGTQVYPQLPIDYSTQRITGLDTRDVGGSAVVAHRAFKATWTLRFTMQSEAEADALLVLGARVTSGAYIGEEGFSRTVLTRGARKILRWVNQATSQPVYDVEIDLEDV